MPIFQINNKKCLFIHIPKSGGSSIEKWLSQLSSSSFFCKHMNFHLPCTPQHFHAEIIENLFAEDYFDYIFTVCRNPFERLFSEYRYRLDLNHSKEEEILSFDIWCLQNLSKYEENHFHFDNHIRPQNEFLAFDCEVFYFEKGMQNVMREISQRLDIPAPNQVFHEKKGSKIDITLDQKLISQIYEFYKEDFNAFGYDNSFCQDNVIIENTGIFQNVLDSVSIPPFSNRTD
ncbi:MAG: sulfotransferase family 2 domain-containing protein [Pseudomonadota bacterium]